MPHIQAKRRPLTPRCQSGTQKQHESQVFTDATGKILFVPTEDMLIFHQAAKPTSVLRRAGLGKLLWAKWQRQYGKTHPWLGRWMYTPVKGPLGGLVPDAPPSEALATLTPTPAMHAFREQASVSAICRAAQRPTGASRAGRRSANGGISPGLVNHWLHKHGEQSWFRPWLLGIDDAPAGVDVVTSRELACARSAWYFNDHLKKMQCRGWITLYSQWLRNRLIPDRQWLGWLYGNPAPDRCFVVTELHWRWRQQRLAGGSEVSNALRDAERMGARDLLAKFLSPLPVDQQILRTLSGAGTRGPFRCGLIAPNFFIPNLTMLAFRKIAMEATDWGAFRSLSEHPCFEEWFICEVVPRGFKGEARFASPAPDHDGALAAEPAQHPVTHAGGVPPSANGLRGGRGRPPLDETRRLYKVCYLVYCRVKSKKQKAAQAMEELDRELGHDAPKRWAHVRKNAHRHCEKTGDPMPA